MLLMDSPEQVSQFEPKTTKRFQEMKTGMTNYMQFGLINKDPRIPHQINVHSQFIFYFIKVQNPDLLLKKTFTRVDFIEIDFEIY